MDAADRPLRTYHVLGVPLRAGSLTPGSENDARAFREAELLTRLHTAGVRAIDEGDLAIPSYLPHHTVPPIRNWPAPRIVWDLLGEHLAPRLREGDGVPLLIGCDCSVVVGTSRALAHAGADVHVLYVDGDFDDAPPDAVQYRSAAQTALWLLTHASPFAPDPPLRPEQVTVIGASVPPAAPDGHGAAPPARVRALSLADVRRLGPDAAARQALATLPPAAAIVLHFDIDVVAAAALPAAYFPHADGLTLDEAAALLRPLAADPRLRVLEVAEYATLADPSRREVDRLIGLLVRALA